MEGDKCIKNVDGRVRGARISSPEVKYFIQNVSMVYCCGLDLVRLRAGLRLTLLREKRFMQKEAGLETDSSNRQPPSLNEHQQLL